MDEAPKTENRETINLHNLQMMNGRMMELCSAESINGYAGTAHTGGGSYYATVTANGYVNDAGKIVAFGNVQDISKEIRSKSRSFSFSVTFDTQFGVHKVVELEDKSGLSPKVLEILSESIAGFNAIHKKD